MAPARKTRAVAKQPQHSFFKVTKPAALSTKSASTSKRKLEAIESVIPIDVEHRSPQQQSQPISAQSQAPALSRKRRRDTPSTSDSENEATATQVRKSIKKLKVQLATPPATPKAQRTLESCLNFSTSSSPSRGGEQIRNDVPQVLTQLQLLHKTLVQSLSVHYAHHGPHKAISLSELTPTMTRLYKKHTIRLQDIARVLAVWELAAQRDVVSKEKELEHDRGPFKLTTNGVGEGATTVVEFAWAARSHKYNELDIQRRYEAACDLLAGLARGRSDSFLWRSIEEVPQLQAQTGQQTRQRQEKISTIRNLILDRTPMERAQPPPTQSAAQSGTELSFSDLKISSSPKKNASSQSRTLSLFDRVKARQLLAASTTAPTSAQLLRRRALARLADIVEILRLKQAQKLNSQFNSSIHGSPSKTATAARMKTCFSLDALVQEIQDSMSIAASAEELRECILILARDMDDQWCAVYSSGGARCVTLQGQGPSGRDVAAWAQKQAEIDA